jgi:5-enolpyruvylshikimate-3-phosphate synthase
MPLPDLIEIVPLDQPVRAEITVPGSKSITNRALILAALADGEVTLKGALWSEDTQIMVECLKTLGFVVSVKPDPDESCNRTIMVVGGSGMIPPGGTETEPVELFVGNAGTAARFLAPFLCLGSGVYKLHGVPRMHERPQAALFSALRELGYRVEAEFANDKLPAKIFAGTAGQDPESMTQFIARKQIAPVPKQCRVSIAESSQFASALLLSAEVGGWDIEIEGENADESPYVVMTQKLIAAFPKRGGMLQIEPDASSGSYFWAAVRLVPKPQIDNVRQTEDSKSNEESTHTAAAAGISGPAESLAGAAARFIRAGGEAIPSFRGDAREIRRQSQLLQEWAKRAGKISNYQPPKGEPASRGAEHEVFFHRDIQRVFKRTYPGTFGSVPTPQGLRRVATPYFYLCRIVLVNQVFGADLRLEGVTAGDPSSVITSQPLVEAADPAHPLPLPEETQELMAQFGFEPVPNLPFDWFRESDQVRVSDARPDNFIKTPNGVVPIDLVVGQRHAPEAEPSELPESEGSPVSVRNWPATGWQVDERFAALELLESKNISRSRDLGDSIMTACVLAPFAANAIQFTDLGRLRVQECERVVALRTELVKCGAKVVEAGDTLTVYPAKPEELHGAEIETYNDHRMAMCFAILGLKVPGIRIKNPACVKKTFPNFFQKLAAPSPHGLGAEIWEVKNGQRTRKLSGDDLFAE